MIMFYIALVLLINLAIVISLKTSTTTIFGATGGVGQLVAKKLLDSNNKNKVIAVTRNIDSAQSFDNLNGANFIEADARNKDDKLLQSLIDCDSVVISLGTTAFPTSKWEDGLNDPQAANVNTMINIMDTIKVQAQEKRKIPNRMILVSSIGVERPDMMPFKILNAYGVLDSKKTQEDIFLKECNDLNIESVIIRPGRLVGEPFTNFDLAKAFGITQGKDQGICIDKREILAGDCERADVANAITRIINANYCLSNSIFSIINIKGGPPTDDQWNNLLSLTIAASQKDYEQFFYRNTK